MTMHTDRAATVATRGNRAAVPTRYAMIAGIESSDGFRVRPSATRARYLRTLPVCQS
jgi:hypothetical protein